MEDLFPGRAQGHTSRLVLVLIALALWGCGGVVGDSLEEYRPMPVARRVDAAVTIEATASGALSTVAESYIDAAREALVQDLATLFTRPSFAKSAPADFVLRITMVHRDTWSTRVVEVTATLADATQGTALGSYRRSAEVAAARGAPGPAELTRIAVGLKQDLVRRFEQDPLLAGRLGPAAPVVPAPLGPPPAAAPPRPAKVERAPLPAAPYGTSWALVVGINEYRHADPLNYAVNDARAVAAALPALGFQRVRVLVDSEATKEAIERVIYQEFQEQMGPQDRLFVFFAGHGITVELPRGGEEGYLVPVDGDPKRPALTAIPMDDVRRIGRRIRAKHVLFAIDSCFSGFALTRDITPDAVRNVEIAALLQEPVVQVLTAGRRGQKAVEEGGHGLFTKRLLDGLRGLADQDRRGFVTATQLAAWLAPRVARDSAGRQTPQYSALDGEGDFVFLLPASRP